MINAKVQVVRLTYHYMYHKGMPDAVYLYYIALLVSRGHLYPNNSRKTPIAGPLWRGMVVFREFEI